MVKEHKLQGYEEFIAFINNNLKDVKTPINVYFTGTKKDDGNSWCSDCVEAEPFVRKSLSSCPEDSILLYVEVGDRTTWKDMKCPFRTDKNTRLLVIPTLLRWNSVQRLEGEQCTKSDLLEMFFTED